MSGESMGPKVAREVAEAEFAAWVKTMRLVRKLDESKLEDADRASLLATKEVILNAIEDGLLARNDAGLFVFNPEGMDPITFLKPTGAMLMAIDDAKSDAGVHRTFKFLAAMSGKPTSLYSKMDLVDVAVCDAVATLFLAK